MKGIYTVPTIILVILIVISIGAVVFFNTNGSTKTDTSINNITPYSEKNNSYIVNNTAEIEKKEEKKSTCIASFTTNITYPDENRTHNIITACEYLNNHVITPDETFSFNDVLGPFNEYQGYVESTGFDANGKIIKITGGGICQVSSTLYNAVLMVNLEIVERHEHSAPVDYVPHGKDATVCYSNVDFKFKNTTKYDITVKCFCDGKTVKIEFYSKK